MLVRSLTIWLLLCVTTITARAAPVTFNAVGSPDVSGFVQFDDSLFGFGGPVLYSNSQITGLSITAFGEVFALSDVDTSGLTQIDDGGTDLRIINGAGLLANNGSIWLMLYPDGVGGTTPDGDASLALYDPGLDLIRFAAVKWEVVQDVPEPATFTLVFAALVGVRLVRARGSYRSVQPFIAR